MTDDFQRRMGNRESQIHGFFDNIYYNTRMDLSHLWDGEQSYKSYLY